MAHNNDALYDAVIAGAGGGAQHGWLQPANGALYDGLATATAAVATAVDLAIPPIVGGPTFSQIQLMHSIASAVFAERFSTLPTLTLYTNIASAITTLWTRLKSLLTNQPVMMTGLLSLDSPVVNGAYREIGPLGSLFPTTDTWWTSPAKLVLLQVTTYTRNAQGQPTIIQTVNYVSGVAAVTITDTITYNNMVEATRSRSVA